MLARFVRDERGATAIEYGLIAGLLSIAIIGGLGDIRQAVSRLYDAVATALTDTSTGP